MHVSPFLGKASLLTAAALPAGAGSAAAVNKLAFPRKAGARIFWPTAQYPNPRTVPQTYAHSPNVRTLPKRTQSTPNVRTVKSHFIRKKRPKTRSKHTQSTPNPHIFGPRNVRTLKIERFITQTKHTHTPNVNFQRANFPKNHEKSADFVI